MFKDPHSEISLAQKKIKLLYISELLAKDKQFDEDVRAALKRAVKRTQSLSKIVCTMDMTQEEILDINNPIEQF